MKTLVVEDDFTSRILVQEILKEFGPIHIAVNGKEALEAAQASVDSGEPYDLICLDIMLPEMDGQAVLKEIRRIESEKGIPAEKHIKIIMTTALSDYQNASRAYREVCDGYLVKPIEKAKLLDELKAQGLIS
jgi:two-component system, chemotaxis family, chemotaxis protein CheY